MLGKDRSFIPEEISAIVLRKMKVYFGSLIVCLDHALLTYLKEVAESYLDARVDNAIITVPTYFNDSQGQATKDVGRLAGLNVVRVVNEPTAAAMAYGLDRTNDERRIIVFDLGGRTFDVSLLTVDYGVLEILATTSDSHLGGKNFDRRMGNYFVRRFSEEYNVDISEDPTTMDRLQLEVEKAKLVLSSQLSVLIEMESLYQGKNWSELLTRVKLEELNIDLFEKTLTLVEQVLMEAEVPKNEIDDIVLVGGSTRIPKVVSMLEAFFDGKKAKKDINPDQVVAFGAAIQVGLLSGWH